MIPRYPERELQIGQQAFEDGIMVRRTAKGVTWWIYYSAPVAPGSKRKKQTYERTEARNKMQAQAILQKRRSEIFDGAYKPRTTNEVTLSEFVPRFVADRAHLRTIKKYDGQFKNVFEPLWGKRVLRSLTRQEIEAWYRQRLQKVATATANNEFAALRSLLTEAWRQELVEVNPAKGIKLKAPHNKRDRILSEAERARLHAAAMARADYLRPLYLLLYATGCRLSEALTLPRSRVSETHVIYHDAKTGAPRIVPVKPDTMAVLRSWLDSHSSPWVFPGRGGKLTFKTFYHKWYQLIESAGVADLTPHHLRHNFVSQLQMAGVSDTVIMDLTGHKTLTMLARYSHSRDDARKRAVDLLP